MTKNSQSIGELSCRQSCHLSLNRLSSKEFADAIISYNTRQSVTKPYDPKPLTKSCQGLPSERDKITFLDVEGAFDNVNVDILLERLASLGCTRRIVKFVQFVTCKHLMLTEGAATAMRLCQGVPQGTVLSPLLYSLYVASLSVGLPPGVCASQFADDVLVSVEATNPAEEVVALESAIETPGGNLDSIGLGISPFKTKLINFNDRNIQPESQRVKIQEHVVSSCSHTKFLGVIFDYRLSFKEHINYVKKKLHLNNEYHEIFVLLNKSNTYVSDNSQSDSTMISEN
uniref:Reverse transcriptase domain-containing protein n=1 Tax=Trichogramma kaykai TaxID=54128 RepID=A0ABD2X6U3_9HYME